MKLILWQLRLLVLGLFLAMPSWANVACENYGSHINWISTFRTEDNFRFSDFTINGTTEWAVGADGNLYVVDVGNPAQPSLTTIHDLQGEGSYIVSSRGIGLLSLRNGLVLVLDLDDPFQLAVTDTLSLGGRIWDAQFDHQLAYVGVYGAGVLILDLSNPNDVVVAGTMRQAGGVVELYGNQAFLISDDQLFTFDLADPFHPIATDSVAVDGYRMKVVDSTLVVMGEHTGFSLYDIAPGQPPEFRTNFPGPSTVRRMELADGLLAVSFMYEMGLYSLADGDTLIERASFHFEASLTNGKLRYSDGVLFHAGDLGINALDLGDGSSVEIGETMFFPGGNPEMPKAYGNYVFVAARHNGLIVYDCSSPLGSEIVGSAFVAGKVLAVNIVGDLAYAMGPETFAIFDISNPVIPRSVGVLADFTGPVSTMPFSDQIVWGVGGSDVINGVDVSDPTAPYLRYQIEAPYWIEHVEAADGLLHSLGYFGDYYIHSLATDPPTLLSSTNPNGFGVSLAVQGDLVALGSGVGITFMDVSDPVAPEVLNNYSLGSYASHVSFHGNRALVSLGGAGLITLDISNPQAPFSLGTAVGTYLDHAVLDNGAVFTFGRYYFPLEGWNYKTRMAPAPCDWVSPAMVDVPQNPIRLDAYPNPFNPRTTLSFDLPADGPCRLVVYDLQGRIVRSLCHEIRNRGPQLFVWDGRDDRGQGVASGVYMARLGHVGGVETRKLALIR